jgi:PTS system beta-glucosides-specific IIC component
MAPVERFFKKVVPDVLATVFVPFLTIAVMVPIALCAVGPIGSAGGTLLGNFFFTLSNAGGIWTLLTCVALGALWMFMVMTGMHIVLVMMAIPALATNGYDACVLLTLFFANASVWGIALGGFAKLKNKAEKGEFLGFFLAGLLGGVTEPTLFGCGFKYNRTLVCMALGGAVGSLVGVLMGAKVLVTTYTSIFMVLAFVGSDVANIVAGATGIAVSVLVAAAATYFFGFTKEQLAQDEREARLFEEQLKNRGKKVAPALNE